MGSLGFLGWWLVASTRVRIVSFEAKFVYICVLRLPFIGFSARSLWFPVNALAFLFVTPLHLVFASTAVVEGPWLAVNTVVHFRYIHIGIVTGDVLPTVAPWAKDRMTIIFFEAANAFDGVIFLLGCNGVGGAICDGRGGARSADRMGIRCGVRDGEGGGICHNPTDNPLSGENKI